MKKEILRKKYFKKTIKKASNALVAKILSLSAFITATAFWLYNYFTLETVFAGNLKSSQFYKGTEKLLKDLSSAILILAPIVTVIVVMYCFIRKGAADEMDFKKWQTRITTSIVCGILAVTAAALINMFASYYGVSNF